MRLHNTEYNDQKSPYPLLKGGCRGSFIKVERRGIANPELFNEKGIALLMVLVLTAISLAIMAGMIYMITQGTIMSGVEKRYTTALEAGKAGNNVVLELIGSRAMPDMGTLVFSQSLTEPCLTDKLNKSTYNLLTGTKIWAASCDSSIAIDTGNTATYDISFNLGTYSVFAKIADTIEGNSAMDSGLIKTGVVLPNSGEIQVQSMPYLYTVEVQSENTTDSAEEAKFSVLYQY